jgi:hypothetical protein
MQKFSSGKKIDFFFLPLFIPRTVAGLIIKEVA